MKNYELLIINIIGLLRTFTYDSDSMLSIMLQVKLEQGLEMLKIFKEHVTKTSILDDFAFYENRQKLMQEKRAKQQLLQGQASICSYYCVLRFCMA